ncbi:tetratricopeptide repeat protein [Thalassotalea sp. LPB0316]|uniref:tetratricopeptide repeat protein n=1 Tax=Thalassotalea sp. LPB0316 TaxID=2769490 RepID=UPI001D04C713|nr:tetratricopeptide repeat protein [Thalassotalea sp. LPB0316]
MFKKLSTSLVLAASVVAIQLPMISDATAATAAEVAEQKKKRPTNLVGPNIGKKIQKAFELYSADDIDGSIAILNEISAKKPYDVAYVNRFLGMMYASKGDHEKESIDYLKKAAEPDVLNWADQAQTLKTIGDLQMSIQDYKGAISHYYAWMEFTAEEDADVWTKIANAHYSLKQLDKVIMPADKAIAAYGDKHNQNPYVLKVTSFYERKMYPEAVDVLETVIQIFPENKQWWTQLGMFYLLVEDYAKALYTLDLAYKKGFLEKEAQIKTLANLFQSNGVPYKAAKLLEKHMNSGLVTRDDKNLIALANAYHAAQDIDDAAKIYK